MNNPIIFKNISVVTPSETGVKVINNCNVSVSGNNIQYVGYSFEDAIKSIGSETYETYKGDNRVIMPCFVNAHTHLAMTLMRNMADDTTLHKWLFDMIFPIEAKMRSKDLNSGTLLAIAEMIKNGIGVAANMYMTADDAMDSQTAIDTGIKLSTVLNGGSSEIGSGIYKVNEKEFDRVFNKYNLSGNGRVKCGVLVHSIYLYNESYYRELADLAKSRNTFTHVHVSETQREVSECIEKYNMRPPAILEKMGIFDVPSIAAHCVFLNDEDIQILKRNNVTAVHNPTSNLKLGSGFADIKKLFDESVNVALGSDGPASNNNLDIFQEMRLASYLAKGIYTDASVVPASQIIEAATINGYKGLGFTNSGRIEAGMEADLQIINMDTPSMTPSGNLISAIVYSANGSNVESMMVSGKMLMKNRVLLTIDEEKAKFEAKESSDYIYGIQRETFF
jgi:5-methylthioadenosine/S-adenosylhomocysteine deaminase